MAERRPGEVDYGMEAKDALLNAGFFLLPMCTEIVGETQQCQIYAHNAEYPCLRRYPEVIA